MRLYFFIQLCIEPTQELYWNPLEPNHLTLTAPIEPTQELYWNILLDTSHQLTPKLNRHKSCIEININEDLHIFGKTYWTDTRVVLKFSIILVIWHIQIYWTDTRVVLKWGININLNIWRRNWTDTRVVLKWACWRRWVGFN